MDNLDYMDFYVNIRMKDGKLQAQVLASPAGPSSPVLIHKIPDHNLQEFLNFLGRTRSEQQAYKPREPRRLQSEEMKHVEAFGSQLFQAVFHDDLSISLKKSLELARTRGQGLRMRLEFGSSDIINLPWEFLFNPASRDFLALSTYTPIVRFLEIPEKVHPLSIKPPLRMLVMISSPQDYKKLEVEREWANLKEAIRDLENQGLIVVDCLPKASLSSLEYQLRHHEYHIFHYIGHGGFDEHSKDGLLVLEGDEQKGEPISGLHLGTILNDERSLRLVVLNACEGARTDKLDSFAGVAQSLVLKAIPAVIGMQFKISDEAAIKFTKEFYTPIAESYPVDTALSAARRAIYAHGEPIEWGTPVLYMSTPDGRIFNIQKSGVTPPEPEFNSKPLEAQLIEINRIVEALSNSAVYVPFIQKTLNNWRKETALLIRNEVDLPSALKFGEINVSRDIRGDREAHLDLARRCRGFLMKILGHGTN